MEICKQLTDMLSTSLIDMGYEIVRISLQGGDVKTVQIMAERMDREGMTLSDCEKISRTASAILDVEDLFQNKYMLEISSPGVDRPLVREADYTRFAGSDAKIETVHDINGRKRFKGKILRYDELTHMVHFSFEDQELQIAFSEIAKAKLLLTDSIMQKQSKK